MKTRLRVISTLMLFLLFSTPLSGVAGSSGNVELVVVKSDNLISICRKYLQDPSKWREIGRINRLKNVNVIAPGQILIVPVQLMRGVPLNGRVVFVRSEVLIREPGWTEWKPLIRNAIVRQGSSIKTGSEAAVEIAFEDGSSFFQQPDTVLDLDASQLKLSKHVFQRFLIAAGRILMRVRHATGSDSRIEILTPSATAVARGTDFRVATGAEQVTTSEVLQGVIDVEAMQRSVVVREGEGTIVSKGQPPQPPRKLLAPPALLGRLPVYRGMPLQLAFEKIEGAVAYRLVLSRDQEGRDAVREQLFKAGEIATLTGLADGTYYCRVLSIDELGLEGPFRPAETIQIRSNPLPPFLQEPVDGSRLRGKTVAFRWLRVRDAASYQLQISGDGQFNTTPEKLLDVKDLSHVQAFNDLGGKFFRIRSVAGDGFAGIWSDTLTFTLVPPPPSPEMEKPALDGSRLHIRWRNQGDRFSYHFQLAPDEAFTTPLVDQYLKTPEIDLERPDKAGAYFVRTSTIDHEGYEGPYSPPQVFEVKSWWPFAAGGGALGAAGILLLILL